MKLIKGKFYYQEATTHENRVFITKYTGGNTEKYLQIEDDKDIEYETGGSSDSVGIKTLREATYEEQIWLEACIKAKKLVEKPTIESYPIF